MHSFWSATVVASGCPYWWAGCDLQRCGVGGSGCFQVQCTKKQRFRSGTGHTVSTQCAHVLVCIAPTDLQKEQKHIVMGPKKPENKTESRRKVSRNAIEILFPNSRFPG